MQVAVEAAGEGATSIVVASRQMDQSPSLYALYAVTQLDALHLVLDIVPPPYQSTCSQKLIAGVGSHRCVLPRSSVTVLNSTRLARLAMSDMYQQLITTSPRPDCSLRQTGRWQLVHAIG